MPDKNKLARLREIGFAIVNCCDLCIHGDFKPGSGFGICKKFTYEHRKHTGEARQLSIHRAGRCMSFEVGDAKLDEIRRSGFLDL